MGSTERVRATTAVYLFLRKGNQILLARRCNTGYQDGNYQVPAGHIEPGELPTQALIREAVEELGIHVKEEMLELKHVSFRPQHDVTGDRVDFFFQAEIWEGEVTNAEPDKCDELLWVDIASIPQNTTPHVRVAIESLSSGRVFSELSFEWMRQTGMYDL